MPISKAEGIKLNKLANKVTGIVHHDYKFVDLIEALLNSAIVFEKEHSEKLVAILLWTLQKI